MPQVKQLSWSKRARVYASTAGECRTWFATVRQGESYTVSQLKAHGYPKFFQAHYHCECYDPIYHRPVDSVRRLSQHRTQAAAFKACEKHHRQQLVGTDKTSFRKSRTS